MRMRTRISLPFLLAAVGAAAVVSAEPPALQGFSPAGSRAERQWEDAFRALPSAARVKKNAERLSARPHHVGSPYDKDNAEWILARFREAGLAAEIETFEVLFPTPKTRVLELLEPVRFTARLDEPVVPGDATSAQKSEQLPTYNAYSIDGDVTGPLVYVNYGLPEDYDELERLGVSVKGAIAIARYGHSWRGVKPKVAGEHGAIGCLIYSDPRDDGYFVDAVYPDGPMRNADGVQRGSVMDFASSSPGDPLTPGIGATPGARRLPLAEVKSITRIPVLPISYGDAQPLLAQLRGPMAPEGFRGALPISYRLGPGPAKVHLKVESSWDTKPVYDVIARIPGKEAPGEWIVRGNHHDAWVNGADDPVSGQAALLEEARALGELLRQGWRPRRTIIYAAWDGEEPMLLGSTEWVEAHAEELRAHAAVYINTDANGRGFFSMGGSHVLERLINGVARDIVDPETKLSVWKRRQLSDLADAKSADDRRDLRARTDLRLETLGSGTDFTAFLDHLGIASLNLGYGGLDDGGVYHSIYDSIDWYRRFSDGDFAYGRALAQTIGTTVLRLADAEVLPLEFTALADTVQKYLKDLKAQLKKKQDEIGERNRQLEEGVFAATFDSRRPTVAPKRELVPPHLNFAPLENAAEALAQAADRYDKALAALQPGLGEPRLAGLVKELNQRLVQSERKLTSEAGLPRRPWFKHLLYAPGVYSGYGARPVPGVSEGIEQKRYAEADVELARAAKAIAEEAALVEGAARALEDAGK